MTLKGKFYTGSLARYWAGLLGFCLFFLMISAADAVETGAMKAPESLIVQARTPGLDPSSSSPLQSALLDSARFFQKWISPIDGPRCSFAPTCSQFGYQAVHDHGPLLGVAMTADRLMRCSYWTEPGSDYHQLPNGSLYDPVSNNLLKQP